MSEQLDAFLARVMAHLTVSRTALRTAFRYLNPYVIADTASGQARADLIQFPEFIHTLADGRGADTRPEYVRLVERVASDFETLAAETPAQRMQRYDRNARYRYVGVRDSIRTDDVDVWPALAAAWRPMANVWRHVVCDLMPDFDDVFAYLFAFEPAAFWAAYWEWMLHDRHAGLNNHVDAYIAELPQTVLEPHRTPASDAACEQALQKELRAMGDDDWTPLQSDRARRALIATRTQIMPAPTAGAK